MKDLTFCMLIKGKVNVSSSMKECHKSSLASISSDMTLEVEVMFGLMPRILDFKSGNKPC